MQGGALGQHGCGSGGDTADIRVVSRHRGSICNIQLGCLHGVHGGSQGVAEEEQAAGVGAGGGSGWRRGGKGSQYGCPPVCAAADCVRGGHDPVAPGLSGGLQRGAHKDGGCPGRESGVDSAVA